MKDLLELLRKPDCPGLTFLRSAQIPICWPVLPIASIHLAGLESQVLIFKMSPP